MIHAVGIQVRQGESDTVGDRMILRLNGCARPMSAEASPTPAVG